MPSPIDKLLAQLDDCMHADRQTLRRRLEGLRRRQRQGKPIDRGLGEVTEALEASIARRNRRAELRPAIDYPLELPVSEKRALIAEAIAEHQVVVIAGETGSGKTTQIPKICLELGRGIAGLIGHTQPRRIAARSVARRISEELHSELGRAVGYKVRFHDQISETSYIKLMTDGILLAEIQSDPFLSRYDTIIIDEAHERSLNIDFLLGYLKRLLPKRPDLKLIITSATINTEGFSRFFDNAPVIEVSGRTYPVETLYRPILGEDEDERDRDLPRAVLDAVDELAAIDPLGDVLVFLPGEREIREVNEALRKHHMRDTEVLPLFSRLSSGEQDRIFQPHRGRRIVLATNVAETSLTVPGIRFVIDPGLARISRYSHRTKVQRLPIEAVSQASARQRAGRCGRVGPGTCIRLYSEADFELRPAQTDPEIRRTNLASVILQMESLGLGAVDAFPFMDPPDNRYIADGYRLLQELQAVDGNKRLTPIGRKLVRLPVDPRLGRMLLAADREGSLDEVLTIVAALSVQDPRTRPLDAQQKADQVHAEFRDEQSDFMAYLNLWNWYHEQAHHLSNSKLRRLCHERFLAYVRLREWHDIHGQLLAICREMGLKVNREPADYAAVHRALLAGLLGHVALKDDERDKGYLGARNSKLNLFPGSGLYKKPPKWIMAAELVETARLYARTTARIDPQWLEDLAGHLVKRSHFEPHWEKKPAQVAAYERVTLYGLPIVAQRRVNYGPIDPVLCRELFIRHALVAGEYSSRAPFQAHNRQLLEAIEALEAKSRRRDVLEDEQVQFEFYDRRIPEGVYSGKTFEKWLKAAEREQPRLLFMTRDELMRHEAAGVTGERFPDHLEQDGLRLPLAYHFEPGQPDDGVTVEVPLPALNQLDSGRLEWLVPGLLEEKLIALIKTLPKPIRRNFVPAVNFARAALESLAPADGDLLSAFSRQLLRMTGSEVPADAWHPEELPDHLRMNIRVVDEQGRTVKQGRDLDALRAAFAGEMPQRAVAGEARHELEREGIRRWDFGPLPEVVDYEQQGLKLRGYPALVDEGEACALRLFSDRQEAERQHRSGLLRLCLLAMKEREKYLKKNLPRLQEMCLYYAPLGKCEDLKDDLIRALFAQVFLAEPLPRDEQAFAQRLEAGRPKLVEAGNRLAETVADTLRAHHELAKLLKGAVSPQRLQVTADIKAQVEQLIGPGFIAATPPQWLPRLPLYLQAAKARLEKYDRDPSRDRQQTQRINALWEKYRQRAEKLSRQGRQDPALEAFRWHVEELRVSLYAQELRTVEKVSLERLEKRWKELAAQA